MGIIYKVENIKNGKIYIGQTTYTLHSRWLQHIREAKDALDGKRRSFPLFHRMIIKYGESSFKESILEECDDKDLDAREKYWIEYYDSYNNGYNATMGGQSIETGKPINQKVSKYSLEGQYICTFDNAREAAKSVNVDVSNIRRNCSGNTKSCAGFRWCWGEETEPLSATQIKKVKGRMIQQYSKQEELIGEYKNMTEAAKITGISYPGIYNTCHGKQTTAGGFFWRFKN